MNITLIPEYKTERLNSQKSDGISFIIFKIEMSVPFTMSTTLNRHYLALSLHILH